jgi:hypothetical protein
MPEWLMSQAAWLAASVMPEPDGNIDERSRRIPSHSRLSPVEKAKMDYQYDLKKKEIWLDKGVFAAALTAAVLVGGCIGNTYLEGRRAKEAHELEQFKMDESRQRFFMEKRLDALFAVSAAMSDVTRVYFAYVGDKKDMPEEGKAEYDKALANAREVINRSQFLFDLGFKMDTDRYYEVLRAVNRIGVTKCADYRDFIGDLTSKFDELCLEELRKRNDAENRTPKMPFADIRFEERIRIPPKQYLDRHFEHWKAQAKAAGKP